MVITARAADPKIELARQKTLSELEGHFNQIKNQAALNCCGPDKKSFCYLQMIKVPIKFCDEKTHPDIYRFCTGGAVRIGNWVGELRAIDVMSRSEDKEVREYALQTYRGGQGRTVGEEFGLSVVHAVEAFGASFKTPVQGGRILVNPFFTDVSNETVRLSELNDKISDLIHELGHECSSLTTQMLATRTLPTNSKNQKIAALTFLDTYNRSRYQRECAAVPAHSTQLYAELIRRWHVPDLSADEALQVSKCLTRSSEALGQKGLLSQCENPCPEAAIEEAYAQSFALVLNRSIWPFGLRSICNSARTSHHPFSADVLKCWLQNSSYFRKKLRQDMGCH